MGRGRGEEGDGEGAKGLVGEEGRKEGGGGEGGEEDQDEDSGGDGNDKEIHPRELQDRCAIEEIH